MPMWLFMTLAFIGTVWLIGVAFSFGFIYHPKLTASNWFKYLAVSIIWPFAPAGMIHESVERWAMKP